LPRFDPSTDPSDYDRYYEPRPPDRLTAVSTEPEVRILYGPKGETLVTVSDRPPIGFHQGYRGER
jgi:hypothetical protein